MSDNNEERGVLINFLAGVGIGAIVGAAAALLMAPKSGSETREDLKKAAQDLSRTTEDLRKRSSEIIESAKTKVQQAYDAGREAVQKRRGETETGDKSTEA
jgi:gas vesicle protein